MGIQNLCEPHQKGSGPNLGLVVNRSRAQSHLQTLAEKVLHPMHHQKLIIGALCCVLLSAAQVLAAADLLIAAVTDNGKTFIYRKANNVETVELSSGFLSNTTTPTAMPPVWNNTGVILYGNYSGDITDSFAYVANDVKTVNGPSFSYDPAIYPDMEGVGNDAFQPQDENGRYLYFGTQVMKKIDLFNNSEPVYDANWPAPICADFVARASSSGFAANQTHFFITCYRGTGGVVFSMSRTNTSDRTIIHLNDTMGQPGQPAMDETYLYWAFWPGTTIARYNFKTGELLLNWTTLPDYGVVGNRYGVWRIRMYRENRQPVMWVLIYPDVTTPYNCLRRVDPATGQQLENVWNTTELCIRNLNDMFIAPNGEIAYMHQPVLPLPPIASPVGPPRAVPPSAAPTSSSGAPSGAPSSGSSAPTATVPTVPKAPSTKTPSTNSSGSIVPSLLGALAAMLAYTIL
jgi:hypothetical protein